MQVEKLNLLNTDIVQSQEAIRMHRSSPLEIDHDGALATQDLKATFKGEGAVIHEVDEEENFEEGSDP